MQKSLEVMKQENKEPELVTVEGLQLKQDIISLLHDMEVKEIRMNIEPYHKESLVGIRTTYTREILGS